MFKIDNNGNLSAVGVFVNEDGRESRSNMTISPVKIASLTPNYMYFLGCNYYDQDGDKVNVSEEYVCLIVRRSDGLIFSASGIHQALNDFIPTDPRHGGFAEDGEGRLLGSTIDPTYVFRITLRKGQGTWEELSSGTTPFPYKPYPKVFPMANGVVATSWEFIPEVIDVPAGQNVGIIYPNGGYDTFNNNSGATYVVLNDAILNLNVLNPQIITNLTSYGHSTAEPIYIDETCPPMFNGSNSWYEDSENVIIKLSNPSYVIYNKNTKTVSGLQTGLTCTDELRLWKEYRCSDGKFYGLGKENGKYTKVVSFDSRTLTFTEKTIGLANEIDITNVILDYGHAKAQLTGMRRSDGYNVAVSLDLKTAEYDILFSAPNRTIVSLLPLN